MSTVLEKLQELKNIKDDFKEKINAKGGSITDTTPFSEYPSQVENLSGGGGGSKAIIDVEELPKASWVGTTVPNTGTVENVYFNTNLTNKEIDKLLSELDYVDMEGMLTNFLLCSSNGEVVVYAVKVISDGIVIGYSITAVSGAVIGTIFSSDGGWGEFNNPSVINSEVLSEMEGTPIGTQNELLSSLFSTTPFEENKPNDKVIYRLPNGKLFEYDPIEENFIQILNDKNFETISESLIGTESITTKEDELIEKIYINNKMSIEEVESTCSNLIMGVFVFGTDLDGQEVHAINILNYDKYLPDYGGGLGITIVYQYLHQVGIEMAVDEHILFASGFVASDYGFNGWNPDENISEIVLNTYNLTKEFILSANVEEEEIIAELGMSIDEYIDKQNKQLINLISSKPFVKAKDVVIKGKEDEILYPETKVSNVKGLDSLLEQAANKLNHYVKIDIEGEITFDEEIYNKIVSALKQNKVVLVDWNTEKSDYSIASLGPVLYRGTVYSMSGGAEMLPYDNDVKFVMQFTIKNEIHLYYWNRRTETVTKEVLSKEIIEVDELPLLEDKPESCYIYSRYGKNIIPDLQGQVKIITSDRFPDIDSYGSFDKILFACYRTDTRILYAYDSSSKTWENVSDVLSSIGMTCVYIDNVEDAVFDYDEHYNYIYIVREPYVYKESYNPNKLYKVKEKYGSVAVHNDSFPFYEEAAFNLLFKLIPCKELPKIGLSVINLSTVNSDGSVMTVYYEEKTNAIYGFVPFGMALDITPGWNEVTPILQLMGNYKGVIFDVNELNTKEKGVYALIETKENIYEIDNVNKIYNCINSNTIIELPSHLVFGNFFTLSDEEIKILKYSNNVAIKHMVYGLAKKSTNMLNQRIIYLSSLTPDLGNPEYIMSIAHIRVFLELGIAAIEIISDYLEPKLILGNSFLGIGEVPEQGMAVTQYSSVPIDNTPTANSINLINSGGVKAYVDSQIGSINTILDEILGEGE